MEMDMSDMAQEIADILADNHALELMNGGEKVKCTLSGHEMPAKRDVLQSYVSGKKYQNLHKMTDQNIEKYKCHLVPSTKKWRKNQLFCTLTLRHLNNKPDHIHSHLDGKRFQKALKRWELCQQTGEEFKARLGGRPAQVDSDPSEDDGEEREEDNLDDLYPPADFRSSNQMTDSESEPDEDTETSECSSVKKTPISVAANKESARKATKRRKPLGHTGLRKKKKSA